MSTSSPQTSQMTKCSISSKFSRSIPAYDFTSERGRRPYFLEAFTGVLVSPIASQRGQTNTCRIAFSAATRDDLDQAISMVQELQIGAATCSIDRLSISF
jgi:hypothetical protein